MMQTATVMPGPQRLRALERANEVRLARAELKRRIAIREICAAEVILTCPWEADTWSVSDLLMSQRRWGRTRCQKFLGRNQISEVKTIGALTVRQRKLLAAQLECAAVLAEIEARMAEREAAQEAEHAVVPAEIEVGPQIEVEPETAEDYVLVGVA
jgi:hypothetical protein